MFRDFASGGKSLNWSMFLKNLLIFLFLLKEHYVLDLAFQIIR